ncbi:hypothetical protein ACIQU5_17535 [Streptomyces sp. NPDC090306]|uniref:hypothetical protein n=1 Tax=Streptomyces sp. NPDC090306 TaxID=3365961 RepID=UPI00382057AC
MNARTHDFRCELDFEVRPDGTHTAHVERWFLGALSLFPTAMEQVLSGSGLDPAGIRGGVCGEPGSMWGFFRAEVPGARGVRSFARVITAKNQDWIVDSIRKGALVVEAGFSLLDRYGMPGERLCRITAERLEDTDWFSLSLQVSSEIFLSDQVAYLDFVRSVAEVCDPSFGTISYAYSLGKTALESRLGPPWRPPQESVPASRSYLRGYDWLTICASELGEKLGGLSALRAGGAFHSAERLGAGGFWLLATPRHEEYEEDAARKVWRSLAPCLRPGVPKRMAPLGEPPLPVIYEDAREALGS